jgi:DNA-directed RNA polymerase subunit RPC12/RpoP
MRLSFTLGATCSECGAPRSVDALRGKAPREIRQLADIEGVKVTEREVDEDVACPQCGSRLVRVRAGFGRRARK